MRVSERRSWWATHEVHRSYHARRAYVGIVTHAISVYPVTEVTTIFNNSMVFENHRGFRLNSHARRSSRVAHAIFMTWRRLRSWCRGSQNRIQFWFRRVNYVRGSGWGRNFCLYFPNSLKNVTNRNVGELTKPLSHSGLVHNVEWTSESTNRSLKIFFLPSIFSYFLYYL